MVNKDSTFKYIDFYCERGHDLSGLAEPLNLFTNLFFILASILALKILSKKDQIRLKNWDIFLLSIILGIIGVGSAAYHQKPTVSTLNFDVIPIALFIHIYITSFFIRVLNFKWYYAIIVLISFIGLDAISEIYLPRDTLNGTIMYIPTYGTLILMTYLTKKIDKSKFQQLIKILILWSLSLFFRTIDKSFCQYSLEIGTHFLWHIFNAIVLYKLILILPKYKV